MKSTMRTEAPRILKKDIPDLARKGMGQACMAWLADCSLDTPKVPHDEGTLRGSGAAFVADKRVAVNAPEGQADPADSHGIHEGANEILGVIGFNTPYAARLHEHPEYNFKESGTGGKFIEKKAASNHKSYMQIIADAINGGSV